MRKTIPGGAALAALLLTGSLGCGGGNLPVDATPDQILVHAEGRLKARKYADAAETLEYYLRSYPGAADRPIAKLRLGDARFGMRDYVLARGEYTDVVQDHPASPYVEEARYKIARCSYASIFPYNLDQSETRNAVELLEDFLRDYPESSFREETEDAIGDCRERLARGAFESGRFYEKQKRLRSAKIQYEHVALSYPETDWACKSRLRLGIIYGSREKWQTAADWLRRVMSECPDSKEAGQASAELERVNEYEAMTRGLLSEGGP